MSTQPNPGYGFRILDHAKDAPKLPTDEWCKPLSSGLFSTWEPVSHNPAIGGAYNSFVHGYVYRRKYTPPPGFELVPGNELATCVPKDCEYMATCTDASVQPFWHPNQSKRTLANIKAFFHPIKPSDDWIKLSDRLPDKYPCEVTNGETTYVATTWFKEDDGSYVKGFPWPLIPYGLLANLTHWKPLKLSDPPKAEALVKSAEELAFDAWCRNPISTSGDYHNTYRACWLACLEFAKGEK